MSAEQTHYDVLGVQPGVDDDVLKDVYRSLVRKFHPDLIGPEGVEKTALVNHAYDVLSDEDLRQEYDRTLHEEVEHEQAEKQKDGWGPSDYYSYQPPADADNFVYEADVVEGEAPVYWSSRRELWAGITSLVCLALLIAAGVHLFDRFADPLDAAVGWTFWFPIYTALAYFVAVNRWVRWPMVIAPFVFPTLGFLAGAVFNWWGFVHAYEVIGLLSSIGLALLLPAALGVRFATPYWWRMFRARPAKNSRW